MRKHASRKLLLSTSCGGCHAVARVTGCPLRWRRAVGRRSTVCVRSRPAQRAVEEQRRQSVYGSHAASSSPSRRSGLSKPLATRSSMHPLRIWKGWRPAGTSRHCRVVHPGRMPCGTDRVRPARSRYRPGPWPVTGPALGRFAVPWWVLAPVTPTWRHQAGSFRTPEPPRAAPVDPSSGGRRPNYLPRLRAGHRAAPPHRPGRAR